MQQSSGSGFIISPDGLIVTNAHVVAVGHPSRRARKVPVTVTLSDGRIFQGHVHSSDSKSDIALVQLDDVEGALPTAVIGRSSDLRVGDWVVALGSPLRLQNSVTAGIVSSTVRHSSELGLHRQSSEYIQTDAAINVGNSGGPLINLDGEVVGINTLTVAGTGGISFAIPIDTAWQVVRQLRSSGHVVRPYIGIRMVALTPAIVQQERQHDPSFPDVPGGVLIVEVTPGSPAQRAGLRPGDVLVQFNGADVRTLRDVMDRLGPALGKRIPLAVHTRRGLVTRHIVTEAARGD